MKTEYMALLVTILVLFGSNLAHGSLQGSEGGIPDDITELTHSVFGDDYIVGGYVVLDSILTGGEVRDFSYSHFTDPYGTLKGATIFWVRRTRPESFYTNDKIEDVDTSIVCIVKNGSMVWHSGSEILGEIDKLSFCFDLNKSRNVDLGLEVREFRKEGIYYLYIISWDGTSGQFISDVDQSNRSVIVTCCGFDVFDLNGDGNYLIRGDWLEAGERGSGWYPDNNPSTTAPYVTYGWNGSKFGFWPGVTQVPGYGFLPSNRIKLVTHCKVNANNGQFQYSYTFKSDSSSKQLIYGIYVKDIDTTDATGFGPWVSMYSWILDSYHWSALTLHPNQMLRAGEEKSGFGLLSSELPVIKTVYAQGLAPLGNTMSDKVTDAVLVNDVKTNSYITKTIGPGKLSSQSGVSSLLDTLTSFTTQSRSLGWIKDQATADKYSGYFASARIDLQQNNTPAARAVLQQVLQQVDIDSTNNLTSEAYALIRYNTEYLLTQLPTTQPGLIVKLINSAGERLTTGSLRYYEGGWKDATNNNDGTFTINTTARTLSLRMTYEYGTQTKSNVTVGQDTAVFQTVNAQIELRDSKGNPIDAGAVQYYAGAWRNFGTTTNGIASRELLPNNYTFRMTYAYGSNDKQQNIGSDPTVVFQTVNAAVRLEDSNGNLMDQGTVQYYAGAWRDFGTTSGGVTTKELLPNNYSFRMTYEFVSSDKSQDISANGTVAFSTVLCSIRVTNSQNQPVDNVQASYYSGGWRQIGSTVNGQVTKELLPANLTFRITYGTNHQDKTQNLSANNMVEFSIP